MTRKDAQRPRSEPDRLAEPSGKDAQRPRSEPDRLAEPSGKDAQRPRSEPDRLAEPSGKDAQRPRSEPDRLAESEGKDAQRPRSEPDRLAESEALVLLDHGSRQAGADAPLLALAEALRRRRPGLAVHVAHLEPVSPSLADALASCAGEGRRRVCVYPLFLAAGRHLERDVPEQLARAARAHPGLELELLAPLGARPELAELVLAGYEAQLAAAEAPAPAAPRAPGGSTRAGE